MNSCFAGWGGTLCLLPLGLSVTFTEGAARIFAHAKAALRILAELWLWGGGGGSSLRGPLISDRFEK
jgi:hypothetical protein